MHIVEGAASVWHYHLSESGLNGKPALCGNKNVMHTDIPLKCWGDKKPSHIPSSYCKECGRIFANILNVAQPEPNSIIKGK